MNQPWSGGHLGTLPSHSTNRMPEQHYYDNRLSHSMPAGTTREEFLRQSQGCAVQNDYVKYGYGSKPVEEQPEMVDDRYITQHGRLVWLFGWHT